MTNPSLTTLAKILNIHTNIQLITLSEYCKMFETVIIMDGWDGDWNVETNANPNITTIIFDAPIRELKNGDTSLIYVKNDSGVLSYKEATILIKQNSVSSVESDWKLF